MKKKHTRQSINTHQPESLKIDFFKNLDRREEADATINYSDEEREFLWQEIWHKDNDVCVAILQWAETGKESELFADVPPKAFGLFGSGRTTTAILMASYDMNYIAAAFTIDWIRRAPEEAIMVLRKGM